MSTKEQILQVSLKLFAEKGYDGVSVREIAKAVGVRESALYKHYKNKEDILNTLVAEARSRMHSAYVKNNVPEAVQKDIAEGYRALTPAELCQMTWNLFEMCTKDEVVSSFRKLLMREQYGSAQIAALYNEVFVSGAVKTQAKTFEALIKSGFFKDANPQTVALHFYAPIFLLFQKYDCEPQNEAEIKQMLFDHVKSFGQNYMRKA